MAIGTISDVGTLINGASADIKPTEATGQWIVHNIYTPVGATCDIEFGDGTDWVTIATIDESMYSCVFHVTYGVYMRITNNSGGSINYGYDGVSIV